MQRVAGQSKTSDFGASRPHASKRATRSRWLDVAILLGLGAIALWLYLPTLDHGIWWDDPITFGAVADRSLSEILVGLRDSPYFRPLTLLFRRLWWHDGVLAASAIHAAQVFLHLAAIGLTWALARSWTGSRLAAVLAALIFAVFPFSHQAVSWTATPQVMLTVLVLTSVLAYTRFRTGGRARRWLALSLGAFGAALFTQEAAAPLCLLFPLIEQLPPRADADPLASSADTLAGGSVDTPARVRWTLGHLAMAGLYALLFVQADRQTGHSGWHFQPEVAAFLLQALALPVARLAAIAAEWQEGERVVSWIAAFLAVWLAVAWGLVRWGQGRLALLCSAWIALVFAAPWAFLDWEYVVIAPRLLYPAVPAIAMLWAMLAAEALAPARHRVLRLAAAIALIAVIGVAVADVRAQERMLAAGTRHLGEAVAAQADPARRLVFINFPDRYAMRDSPYPLGTWGVTLAPVVQSLSDYAVTLTGHGAETASWSMPQADVDALATWPYQADLRGVRIEWPQLVAEAREADGVYLSRYRPDGSLRLDPVGGFRMPVSGYRPGTEILGDFGPAQLLSARMVPAGGNAPPRLHLTWQRGAEPGPALEDTAFVHVVDDKGTLVANADGDSWGGLLPPKAWPADRAVLDVRTLDVSRLPPGRYAVKVGFYNRTTGVRYALRGADGRVLPEDAVAVGEIVPR